MERKFLHIGASPSGKATDSDSVIRVFESLRPSHEKDIPSGMSFFVLATKRKNARGIGCDAALFRHFTPYARETSAVYAHQSK